MLYSLCTTKNYFSLAPLSHSPLLQFKPCHSRPLDNGIQLILREQVGAVFDEDLSPDCFDENTSSAASKRTKSVMTSAMAVPQQTALCKSVLPRMCHLPEQY